MSRFSEEESALRQLTREGKNICPDCSKPKLMRTTPWCPRCEKNFVVEERQVVDMIGALNVVEFTRKKLGWKSRMWHHLVEWLDYPISGDLREVDAADVLNNPDMYQPEIVEIIREIDKQLHLHDLTIFKFDW